MLVMLGGALFLHVCIASIKRIEAAEGRSERLKHVMRREQTLGVHGHRTDRRCGPGFDHAACNALSEFPCCSLDGFCGNLDRVHCQCDGCVDFRQFVSESDVARWHAEVWQNACGSAPAADHSSEDERLVRIADICPHCVPGKLAVPGAENQNVEVSDEVAPIQELDFSKWGRCIMECPGQSESEAPTSVWRIDVLSTSSHKVPYIRWPCSVHSDFPHTGAQVLTHLDAIHWARMMLSSQDDFFNVDNALDIGAGVGHTALRLGLFSHGRVVAFEAQPRNYELLKFFAEINPALGLDVYNYVADAAALDSNPAEVRSGGQVQGVNPVKFIERNYDEEFLFNIGFVNINAGVNVVEMFRSLGRLLRHGQPAVHIPWETDLVLCAADGLFAAMQEADYAAHNTHTGARIMQPTSPKGCAALENVPLDSGRQYLLLLPTARLDRLGPLSSRWKERELDPGRYVKPLLSQT